MCMKLSLSPGNVTSCFCFFQGLFDFLLQFSSISLYECNADNEFYLQAGHEPGYTVFATLGSFYIPLLLLLFLYGRIYRNIHSYVKRSESRTVLSSAYSDDSRSAGKRKSSLLSFLRKSHSKGSIKSRKNSQLPNISPSNQRRQSADNSPLNQASRTSKQFVTTQQEYCDNTDTVQENTLYNQISIPERRRATSPKEYRRKVYSHPSASSPTASARYKRSAFMRRQMAIDRSHEETSPKHRKTLPNLQIHHPSILITGRYGLAISC